MNELTWTNCDIALTSVLNFNFLLFTFLRLMFEKKGAKKRYYFNFNLCLVQYNVLINVLMSRNLEYFV